jgi:NNP family nitrate/nitrite transporter-like MFS transporter
MDRTHAETRQGKPRQGKPRLGRHWIEHWDPEDPAFWEESGRKVAGRNLLASVFAEHLGFSLWSIWSVLVLFMVPASGFSLTPAQKFLLVSVVTLVGSLLRVPYTLAVPRFGGRNWTIFSALVLLVPAIAAIVAMRLPGLPLWALLLIAATAGLGGGNFSSSMANINAFFPERLKGRALGLNAGGGNIGVAVVQLAGLAVIAWAGVSHPGYLPLVYLPLILIAGICAMRFMDNLSPARTDLAAQAAAIRDRHFAAMSLLYIGTFGSFIGYSFAFGLVLQTEFGRTPLAAAALTFVGPLLGSLSRPAGGWLADRLGAAQVTLWNFAGMAACAAVLLVASAQQSFTLFVAGFIVLFVLSGVGNGSTFTMIPGIFAARARQAGTAEGQAVAMAGARRIGSAMLGIVGAVGAFGGVLINLAFRASFSSAAKSAGPALIAFLAFYAVCFAVTYAVYVRRAAARRSPAYETA